MVFILFCHCVKLNIDVLYILEKKVQTFDENQDDPISCDEREFQRSVLICLTDHFL